MQLAPELTIADLVKMGMKQIRIVKAEEPLPDGWWRDCGESPNVRMSDGGHETPELK